MIAKVFRASQLNNLVCRCVTVGYALKFSHLKKNLTPTCDFRDSVGVNQIPVNQDSDILAVLELCNFLDYCMKSMSTQRSVEKTT